MFKLRAPLDIGFEITGSCTLTCKYCYAHTASRSFVAVANVKRIRDQLLSAGIFSVSIEGGEPFLHPHWDKITRLFVDSGIDVAILTNGTICNQHTVSCLLSLSKQSKFFTIQVSLDSYDPIVNDVTRGNGKDVVQNIFRLADVGLDITVAMVIQSINVDNALDTIEKLRHCVRRFHMMNLMPIPRANTRCSELFVEGKRLSFFWDQVDRYRDENPDLYISTPNNVPNLSFGIGCFRCKGCVAGTTRATISPDLLLLPCGLCPDWIMGDLNNETFEQAWNSDVAEIVRNHETPLCMEA